MDESRKQNPGYDLTQPEYDWQFAWATGYFEGEGYIYVRDNRVEIGAETTDRDSIENMRRVFQCGNISYRNRGEPFKPSYRWYVTNSSQAGWCLEMMMPYLMTRRRAKAEEALETLKRNRNYRTGATA